MSNPTTVEGLLSSGNRERIVSPLWGRESLYWEGRGVQVQIPVEEGEEPEILQVFAVERTDKTYIGGKPSQPSVVRLIETSRDRQVRDIVLYSVGEEVKGAEYYQHPKEIEDQGDYLRGEWPIPTGYIELDSPEGQDQLAKVLAFASMVSGQPGEVIEISGLDGPPQRFTVIGDVPLMEMGTPPIYPVRRASDFTGVEETDW
jgi:hypothetical protein